VNIDNPNQAADHEGQKSTAKVLAELFRHREAGGLPEQGITKAATVAKAAKPEDVVAARDAASAQAKSKTTGGVTAHQSSKAKPSVIACYDSQHNLLGVVAPDDLTEIPAGSAVYDASGAVSGVIGKDGKVVALASGIEPVAKAINAMVTEATKVAKQLQAQRVAKSGHTPTGADAEAVLWAIGQRMNSRSVKKAGDSNATTHPLVAAALAYDKASPSGQAAIRKALGKCTPVSRKRAQVALRDAVYDTVGPRR
jgi:hypothetical protein